MASRTRIVANGFRGGRDGAARTIKVDGRTVDPRARVELPVGGEIELVDAGGGGFGNPAERSAEAIAADLAEGRNTRAFAAEHYPAQLATLDAGTGTPSE